MDRTRVTASHPAAADPRAVDWLHRGGYIRTRSQRKRPAEFDIEPRRATEAVVAARAVIRRAYEEPP